ncbi:FAD-dependent oxidoreductase [Mumia sp. zg.B17]|uniref:FAD-dependent oxidoreductase n=1 Tax=Mumia sp. zg.B17 TaxID=2855446 RepID=UPI001C6E23AD|nr:FAD-dependent oxidoreductase [Mumia sp. zg.B17]MBW9207854.1 FAD-dependent oxidoreductase [Mumia sp. zg.B17]
MHSWWYDQNPDRPTYSPLSEDLSCDVVVVGAGLVGATTALALARAGTSVVVLEGRTVAAGTTGGTTGKVSLLQGSRLSTLQRHHPERLRGYVEANRSGQEWIRAFCQSSGLPYDVRDAVTYATTAHGESQLRREHEACVEAGLPVVWEDSLELPYEVRGAIRLAGQGQIDAVAVTDRIMSDAVEAGARLFEQTRVLRVDGGERPRVRTEHATVDARHVVLATGIPILDRGGFFARLSPERSYAAAFRTDGPAVDAMHLSIDTPTRSLRTSTPDESVLVVGGNGHTTGRARSEAQKVDDLVAWSQSTFGVGDPLATWSAQDYAPASGLPYVGRLLPNRGAVHVATGFNKWGLAMGAAAGLALAGDLLGETPSWRDAVSSWRRPALRDAAKAAELNASVGVEMGKGWVSAAVTRDGAPPSVGGVPPCADSGNGAPVSAVCTHLGGIVEWNDAERSWDCPLHGSRFAEDGSVIEGPATRPLKPCR